MAAFRAPGFVEGTFALECLLDELAAKLGIDPLELRRRNYADSDRTDDRPFSSKNLAECYRRAEPHWAKRDEVRARSQGPWKHGIGLASQIWYGGGGPPSYAWIRVGADGHAQVVTAMQDIGTGTRTAMAQIAAEELGIPLEHVQVSLGDSARGPFASISAGSSPAVDGTLVRSAAGDARRQIIEIAAQRFHLKSGYHSRRPDRSARRLRPLTEVTACSRAARSCKGAGAELAGMQVRPSASVAETSGRRDWRGARRQDRRDPRRRPGDQRARRQSQVEGGSSSIGHTLSEERIVDPSTGSILTRTLTLRMPTIADAPEIVTDPSTCRIRTDEPRLERPRRAANHSGRSRDCQRHSRCDRSGDSLAADHPRRDVARAARGAGTREGAQWSSCGRLAPRKPPVRWATARARSRAGRSSSRCFASG
jgi:xanthine dehydrogenase YagR molybdenum-binding subunit